MAIDTEAKRRSATTTSVSWGPATLTPDATAPLAWRQSSGWGYEGIASDAPVADPEPTVLSPGTWIKTQPCAQIWSKSGPDDQNWSAA